MSAQAAHATTQHVPGHATRFEALSLARLDALLDVEQQAYTHPWTRGNFIDTLAAGYQAELLLAGDTLLGYYVAMQGVQEAHLLNITVRPQSQGRGLGLQLLEHLMQRARQLGAGECFLEVRASNQSAYRLYERYGFNEVGRRRDYYPAAGGREDALVMACTLFD